MRFLSEVPTASLNSETVRVSPGMGIRCLVSRLFVTGCSRLIQTWVSLHSAVVVNLRDWSTGRMSSITFQFSSMSSRVLASFCLVMVLSERVADTAHLCS